MGLEFNYKTGKDKNRRKKSSLTLFGGKSYLVKKRQFLNFGKENFYDIVINNSTSLQEIIPHIIGGKNVRTL
jgi:hypothetical protein